MAFDPVCGMYVDEKETEYSYNYQGTKYYFCISECQKHFTKNPEKFIRGEILIELDRVWRVYKIGQAEVAALKDVRLQIREGSFLAIMGPSGSGKSTLLNIIGCLDIPTKGRILLEGQDISKLSESNLAQVRGRKIGFIFQQFNLISSLTALENVMLPMIFQSTSDKSRRKRAQELLLAVGLADRASHHPAELSGGEQQRVAIARALANEPKLILADEPTGNLDSATGQKIMDILMKLHREYGKTIVVATHDPYIASYALTPLNLKDGEILRNHILTRQVLWGEK
jgi:putative ABC transport system ATP-binding protein